MSEDLTTHPIPASFFDPREDTLVTWLGMAGALLNARGAVLLIDPLISLVESGEPGAGAQSEAGYRLRVPLPIQAAQVPRADLVMVTHADDDHVGRLTHQTLARQTACRFLVPPPVAKILGEIGIPAERITLARDFDRIPVGPLEVEVTPALHDWQETDPWQRGDCCGFLLHTPDGVVWHPGDTRLIPELLAVRGVDVLFFDVAAVDSHLGPAGSARLAESSGAKRMIAYHYGTFDLPPGSWGGCDPRDALPFVEGLPGRFLMLNQGEILKLPLKG
jgi:L-ascorbate metabolism protein UlaG (beta-lactamase superfamily)